MKTSSIAIVLALAVTAGACNSNSSTSPLAPSEVSQATSASDATPAGQNGRAALPTIAQVAVGNPDFSTLVKALTKANLVDLFNGSRQFTVFAPTNAAFDAAAVALLGAGSTGEILVETLDVPTLTAVLQYHVTQGSRIANGLVRSGSVRMLDGNSAAIVAGAGGAQIEGANIVATDIRASNGIVHVIDAVLLPPSLR